MCTIHMLLSETFFVHKHNQGNLYFLISLLSDSLRSSCCHRPCRGLVCPDCPQPSGPASYSPCLTVIVIPLSPECPAATPCCLLKRKNINIVRYIWSLLAAIEMTESPSSKHVLATSNKFEHKAVTLIKFKLINMQTD